MFIVFLIVFVLFLCLLLFIIFLKGNYYETPSMSVQKKCVSILKKLVELEKVALSLSRDETLERFSCKRCIKQNNFSAASTKARKCIELKKQSQAYFSLCERVRIFLEQVNLASDKKDKRSKELLHLFNLIADGVNFMNLGLIELYLELFEKKFAEEIKQKMKEVCIISYMDAFKNVSQKEIDHFIQEMNLEAKEDEKTFLYKKIPLNKDVIL